MINKIQKPRTKQELIKAISRSNIKNIEIYEDNELNKLPLVDALKRQKYTVILLR
jgi:hypothetical protein